MYGFIQFSKNFLPSSGGATRMLRGLVQDLCLNSHLTVDHKIERKYLPWPRITKNLTMQLVNKRPSKIVSDGRQVIHTTAEEPIEVLRDLLFLELI